MAIPRMSAAGALLAIVALAGGCIFGNVVALEPGAKNVKIVRESDKPLHCEFLGRISGTSRSGEEKEAREGARNDFRNHAAELKANFALIEAEQSSRVGTSQNRDYFLRGQALSCKTDEMIEAEEKKEEEARVAKEEQEAKEQAEREAKEREEKEQAKAAKKKKKK